MKYDKTFLQVNLAIGLLLAAGTAHAGIGETPFSLTLGQSILHDSNVERTEGGRSDTVSNTSVAVSFDKEYGRQSYSAAVQGMIQRYQDLTVYNNTGYNVTLKASTGIGLTSKLEIEHNTDQSIQDFEFQGLGKRSRKTVTSNETTINGYHGLYGRWKLVGNLAFSNVDYDTSLAENRESKGGRVGLRYAPTDLLYFESGIRRTRTDYPELQVFSNGAASYKGDRVQRTDLDFQSGWTITGYSNLFGQINLTREKHESLLTGQPGDSARDYSGVTGSLTWNYTPRGKLAYSVKFARDTNNSGGFSSEFRTTAQDRLNTSLDLNARWLMTHKITLRAGLGLQRIEEDEQQRFSGGSLTEKSTGTRRVATLSADYELDRSWSFGCALSNIDRAQTIFNSGYVSNAMSCSGNFLMD